MNMISSLEDSTSKNNRSHHPPFQGRNHGWKVEGDQGLGVGCGRASPPPAVRVRGYHPRKIFENTNAKSCMLVTTCCEISCFLKTTAKKLGDQYIVGGPVSPGPYGCCAYAPFSFPSQTSPHGCVPLGLYVFFLLCFRPMYSRRY